MPQLGWEVHASMILLVAIECQFYSVRRVLNVGGELPSWLSWGPRHQRAVGLLGFWPSLVSTRRVDWSTQLRDEEPLVALLASPMAPKRSRNAVDEGWVFLAGLAWLCQTVH